MRVDLVVFKITRYKENPITKNLYLSRTINKEQKKIYRFKIAVLKLTI